MMRQLKIDVLSVLVVTDKLIFVVPTKVRSTNYELGTSKNSKLINKLELGEPQASGILSPAYWRGGKFNSPGRTCLGVARRAKTEALG